MLLSDIYETEKIFKVSKFQSIEATNPSDKYNARDVNVGFRTFLWEKILFLLKILKLWFDIVSITVS